MLNLIIKNMQVYFGYFLKNFIFIKAFSPYLLYDKFFNNFIIIKLLLLFCITEVCSVIDWGKICGLTLGEALV